MVHRSWLLLPALLLVAACTDMPGPATSPQQAMPPPPSGPPRVALLVPLTGPRAGFGQAMVKAAQMVFDAPGSPPADVIDTGGDATRAGVAAQQAVAKGARMILGPLTAEETASVGPVAQSAGVPVLAFTSDPSAASPGVWTLGLTPRQQVRRLVAASRDDGRQHLAAILPQGGLGDALQAALSEAATEAGMEPPTIERPQPGVEGFTAALKTLSNYGERHGEVESRIKALREDSDPASRQQAAELAARPVPPPPFDALFVGEAGDALPQEAEVLRAYDARGPAVRVMGPALWAQQVSRLARLSGAWYASFDPSSRAPFVAAYQKKYGATPPPIADFAFDAAAIARVVFGAGDFSTGALTREEGFTGVDGALLLLPDGHVRRALAIWQINGQGGARIASPAPEELGQPGA